MRLLEIRIPAVLPSANTIERMHWTKRHPIRQAWNARILVAIANVPRDLFQRRVIIRVSCTFPPKRQMYDAENIYTKGVIDFLKGKFLEDDGPKYVEDVRRGPCTRGAAAETVIRIEEVE